MNAILLLLWKENNNLKINITYLHMNCSLLAEYAMRSFVQEWKID